MLKKTDSRMESLRQLAKFKGIPMYVLADAIGVHPSTLCVWFRRYDFDHYNRISEAIQQIEGGEDHDEDN